MFATAPSGQECNRLKRTRLTADIYGVMTTTSTALKDWDTKPLGKVARFALGISGTTMAALVLLMAVVVDTSSWILVLLGVTLATSSVRAARIPSLSRLGILTATVIAIPLSIQIL